MWPLTRSTTRFYFVAYYSLFGVSGKLLEWLCSFCIGAHLALSLGSLNPTRLSVFLVYHKALFTAVHLCTSCALLMLQLSWPPVVLWLSIMLTMSRFSCIAQYLILFLYEILTNSNYRSCACRINTCLLHSVAVLGTKLWISLLTNLEIVNSVASKPAIRLFCCPFY